MSKTRFKRLSSHRSVPTEPAPGTTSSETSSHRNARTNLTSNSQQQDRRQFNSSQLPNESRAQDSQTANIPSTSVRRRLGSRWKGRIATLEPFLQTNGFLYTSLILYTAFNIIVFLGGATSEWEHAVKHDQPLYLRFAFGAARGGGALLNANSALIVLVAARRLITYLRTTFLNMVVPFDKAMPQFHTLVGHVLIVGAVLHCAGHGVNYIANKLWTTGFRGFISLFFTGLFLVILLVAIRVTVIPRIRKTSFEVFYYTHVTCFVLYYIFLIVHGSHHGTMSSWRFVVAPLAIYVADRVSRLLRENVSRFEIAQSAARIQSSNVVCLRVPRTFKYLAGQYCDIKVPQVSTVEWHPFTIASSPHESEMLFFIKVNGDWTRRLYDMFNNPSSSDTKICQVHVRGPFGAPAQHVGQYEHVVLISGGVGATPFASIAKYAHNWILNYTERGATVNSTVSAAIVRNPSSHVAATARSPRDDPSGPGSSGPTSFPQIPGAPPLFPASSSSKNMDPRSLIRNVSNQIARNMSRKASGAAVSRQMSSHVSQPSTSTPSMMHPPLSQNQQRKDPSSAAYSDSSASRAAESRGIVFMNRSSSPAVSEGTMTGTESVPDMSTPRNQSMDPSTSSGVGLSLPGPTLPYPAHNVALGRGNLGNFLTDSASTYNTNEACGDDDLGDPDAPVRDRRTGVLYSSASTNMSSFQPPSLQFSVASTVHVDNVASGRDSRHMLEVVREYNSSESLFSESDEDEENVSNGDRNATSPSRSDSVGGFRGALEATSLKQDCTSRTSQNNVQRRGFDSAREAVRFDSFGENEYDPELGDNMDDSAEFDNRVMRDVPLVSNAANLIGLSYGSTTMMRHLMGGDTDRHMRASLKRASMTMMDEALDNASWQEQALFYLHTVTINWFLLWTMLLRYSVAAIAAITDGFLLGQKGLAVFNNIPLVSVDLVLAIVLAVPIFTAVVLEVYMNGVVAFLSDSCGNMFDIVLLMPLSGACVVLDILYLAGLGENVSHVSKITLLVFWPIISLLVLWRIGRTIGSRVMLAQYFRSTHSQTKSLDFIWVSKTHDEDEWLVREMLPLAESNIVRLHRYITREGPTVEPWTLDYERIPLKTHHVRPDWDKVFSGIAERSKSGTIIGVFHCGPSNMSVAVQQGAMKAMAKSLRKAYRCGYTQAMAAESRCVSLGTTPSSIPEGARYGCAVRFSLREENFG